MTAGPHPTPAFNTVAPDVAACKISARVWHPRRTGWGRCHVLFVDRELFSVSFLAVFCINRKSYFSLLTSKRKFGRASGKRGTRDCVRVKHIKSEKWGVVRRWEKILGPDISPVLLQGCIYFVHVVYLSFHVRKTFLIVLSAGGYFYLQSQYDTLSGFYLSSFLLESRVIITFFLATLEILQYINT